MREGSCFLRLDQTPADFTRNCYPADAPDSVPSVLLWGDSFAAHYAPALEKRQDIRFGQLTTGACPPLLVFSGQRHKECLAINRYVAAWVATHQPDVVVLAARWNRYRDFAQVDSTVGLLLARGVDKLVIIGSSAQFDEEVPRLLARRVRNDRVPVRLPGDDMQRINQDDAVLRTIAARRGVKFVAPIGLQCNSTGCLAALDEHADRVTTWDDGHLTEAGAAWIVDALMADLFVKRYALVRK